jgi:hypothetical protein
MPMTTTSQNQIGLDNEGNLNIQVNREEQFPRLLKALRKGETLTLHPTIDRTLHVGNLTEETWSDGKTRGILFKPKEQVTLALNGKILTRNFWGGNQKTEIKKIVVSSRQSKMVVYGERFAAFVA